MGKIHHDRSGFLHDQFSPLPDPVCHRLRHARRASIFHYPGSCHFYALHMVPPPAHRWPHQSGCDLASCPLPHHSCPFEPFFLFQSILLHVNGARRAKGDDLAYIEACLDPVLQKAGLRRSDFTLYIQDTAELNAYALATIISSSLRGSLTSFPWTR